MLPPAHTHQRKPPAQVMDADVRIEKPHHATALKFQRNDGSGCRVRGFAEVLHAC